MKSFLSLVSVVALLGLPAAGCGAGTPAPQYPSTGLDPDWMATDLAQYMGEDEDLGDDGDVEEEELIDMSVEGDGEGGDADADGTDDAADEGADSDAAE